MSYRKKSRLSYCSKVSFILVKWMKKDIHLNMPMPTLITVMVDGPSMVLNKVVYLSNHWIDGSKILQNLILDIRLSIQSYIKIGDGKVGSTGALHMEWTTW